MFSVNDSGLPGIVCQ